MDRWQNKIAVVTGASAGIGAATCKALVEKGMIVVGLARRLEKMETQIKPTIDADKQQNFHCYKCDVGDEESVKQAFDWIEQKFGGVDVLVNNAGVARGTQIIDENNSQAIKDVINTNILGVVWCTRAAFQNMNKRQIDGHVVMINSVLGHRVPYLPTLKMNVYPSTKYAVTAMTEVLRQEFLNNETKIKITSISPGSVRTDIMGENFIRNAGGISLNSEDVADAVVYCIQTPAHVQIHELIIKPMGAKN